MWTWCSDAIRDDAQMRQSLSARGNLEESNSYLTTLIILISISIALQVIETALWISILVQYFLSLGICRSLLHCARDVEHQGGEVHEEVGQVEQRNRSLHLLNHRPQCPYCRFYPQWNVLRIYLHNSWSRPHLTNVFSSVIKNLPCNGPC